MKKQFYTDYGNIQVIISLLKQYGIRHIVVSAGTRHSPFIHSLENERLNRESFFKLYSVVDERSASFMALGLIQKLGEPVAIACTSGTATCNYVSAVQEAYFQRLPLLIISADRNPMYLYQQEEQMSVQPNLFAGVCKMAVTLPIVRDEKDRWYCSRLVNEALLELTQGQPAPVHINYPVENNYPVEYGFMNFDTEVLPSIKKIERLVLSDSEEKWSAWREELQGKKILVIYGQHRPLKQEEKNIVETFCRKYNCVISVDLLSNLSGSKTVESFMLGRILLADDVRNLLPDVIITMYGNSVASIKDYVGKYAGRLRHIHVAEEGKVSDPFKCLPDVIACSPLDFFEKFSLIDNENQDDSYFHLWNNHLIKIKERGSVYEKDIPWSAVYTTQQVMARIPEDSLVHLANSNSVRICNFFPVKNGVEVYCNRGTNGIDGSMSSFIGNSMYHEKLSFLFIGDLSFFYDMNALWNRYVHNRMRIFVNNNEGGAIFYTYPSLENIPTLADNIAAEHGASVRAWAEDRGFLYYGCHNEGELNDCLNTFFDEKLDKPVLVECFTSKEGDALAMKEFPMKFAPTVQSFKSNIAGRLSPELKTAIKKILR
ncbi:MAG: 2-succinyl-5-enolpyruvyl-6-hydroxy-3-cyclohexene-1-carboxylic-acid synthase [Spirochaetaceae bacterium]|nr:2-succinyl-5-enolpyruvyl-6-hydroxy-3-cyclohexene-1-carboxylic-acid synthase [Spirochaetaceae bacterium]